MTDGFLAQRRRSPASLVAIVAAHALVIGALATSVSHIARPDPVIRLVPITDPPPPPPPRQQPQPKAAPQQPASHIEAVRPIVQPVEPQQSTVTIDLQPLPSTISPVANGTDTAVLPRTIEPAKPAPVLVEASVDPRFAGDLQPPYPAELERSGTEGTAVVRVLIGSDGRVRQVENVRADDPAFFAATERQALRHWRFRASTRDGAAVESWKVMTVRFTLPKE